MHRICVILAVAALCCSGCKERWQNTSPPQLSVRSILGPGDTNSLGVSVFCGGGPIGQVTFTGRCVVVRNGVEQELSLVGTNGKSIGFLGTQVSYCEVQKTSDIGWMEVTVYENSKTLFQSDKVKSHEVVRYKFSAHP